MNRTAASSERDGLLLVGHGTRDLAGSQEFFTAAAQVAALCPDALVEPAFLELALPTIADAVAALYEQGARRLTVAPLLLFEAGHAKRDIPRQVARAAAAYGDLKVRRLLAPLGCHPAMVWLSELRYRQALCGRPAIRQCETLLALIGRGSSDSAATAEMRRFAALRRQRTPVGWLEVGFLAVERPTLDETLRAAAESSCRRVVVQPHLLFRGQLVEDVRLAAERFATQRPEQQWIVAPHLGPGKSLARAIAQQCGCLGWSAASESEQHCPDAAAN